MVDAATGAPSEVLAETLNSATHLLDRLTLCQGLHGRYPTFVAVDFVELGAPQTTVRMLNAGRSP